MNIEKSVLSNLADVEYVSFDIFDTLLLRMVRIPYQIFDKTHETEPSLFPEYISDCEWREIRIFAEKYAREKKQKQEITLEDIYQEIPDIIENQERIMELEIEMEEKNTFLNPEMSDLLNKVKKIYGKKVLLISDMYLSESSIIRILEANHLDMSLIDRIYVSSEYGKRKSDGTLYKAVCESLQCVPNRILHIGDNWNADYIRAKKVGIRPVYYPVISEGKYRYPFLDYEREYYGDLDREIYSIRLLAAESEREGEEREWFEMGAMILGPLLTFATHWVLDIAEKNNIYRIYPMMREGYFLAELLKRAAEYRGWNGIIQPMYISRRALYPALLSVLKRKDINYLFSTRKMTVGAVLDLFATEELPPELLEYKEISLCEAQEIFPNKKSVYQILEDYLMRKETIEDIRERNKDADELIWSYFKSLEMDCEDFITFDVGWRGNAQNAIERIRGKRQAVSRGIHLVITGKKEVLKERNLEDGTDLRGFSANFGENFQAISNIMIPIFEMLLMCREGTTIGYENTKDGVVRPICKKIAYAEQQMRMMETVQEGIMSFQNALYAVYSQKGEGISQRGDALLKIVTRLMAMPLKREAELIGNMQYDQNFGVDEKWRIISPENLRLYKSLGYNEFTHQKIAREDEWYQGMNVCIDSLTYYRQAMFHRRNGASYHYLMYLERICKEYEHFVLAGAGNYLRVVLMYLHMMGETDRIAGIVSGDIFTQGEKIGGYLVYPLEADLKCSCYALTSYRKKAVHELKEQLYRIKGTDINVQDLYC